MKFNMVYIVPVGNDYIFWPLGLVSGHWINIHSAEVSIQFLTLFYAPLNSQFQAAWLVHVNLHDYKHMLHIHVHLIRASLNLYTVELCSSAYRTPILFYSMSDANQCPRSNSIHILTPLSAELKGSEAARAI